MPFLPDLAWRDLRGSGRSLWIFCACLVLGVALVSAGGGLYRQVADSMQADVKALFGGDVELRSARPLGRAEQDWLERHGTLSRGVQMRTMLRAADGRSQLVQLQSADANYPLYGRLTLSPAGPLADLLTQRDGLWGVAIDPVLARRLGLAPGDRVELGDLTLEVRTLLLHQPDRSLRADWNGAPVLLADGALAATGLVQPLSRIDWRYRVATAVDSTAWRSAFAAAFPQAEVEIRTAQNRGDRIAQVLSQIGSGLLLVGFSSLFIGGLGVFNSMQAYLQGKLASLATLRALGLRDDRLARLVLLQLLMLALGSSLVGALIGGALALGGLALVAENVPVATSLKALAVPLALAVGFGVLTALCFALPALGRALSVSPAALFRGIEGGALRTPRRAWALTAACAALLVALLVAVLPQPLFGGAFVAVVAALLLLLEGVLRALRAGAAWALKRPDWQPGFELRVALSGLQRPGSPLRPALLSLGSALTLLVACTLVVASLWRTVNDTVPRAAPALLMHDVQPEQLTLLRETLSASPSLQRVQTAPLVIGRLVAVNGRELRMQADSRFSDEHKLSQREGNIDDVIVQRGAWWPPGHRGAPQVAMEDREADALGLRVGDRLSYQIQGERLDAELVAIYAQRRFQSRLWLEGIFSDGALDRFVTRHVGAAWMSADDAIAAQDRLAAAAPNIASVRTATMLETVEALMRRASGGLLLVAGACLAASLLVLASVVAASRARLLYEASLMHALGARLSSLRRVLRWEYALLAAVTAGFSLVMGSALATVLLRWRLELDASGLYWTGAATALLVSTLSLWAGAAVLWRQMRLSPAALLRGGA